MHVYLFCNGSEVTNGAQGALFVERFIGLSDLKEILGRCSCYSYGIERHRFLCWYHYQSYP